MSLATWSEQLRAQPAVAVHELLSGAISVSPYERAAPHEFLLALLPRATRRIREKLLGEPTQAAGPSAAEPEFNLKTQIDSGLKTWLLANRARPLPQARKLSAYAAQVSEALQWPAYFDLPQTVEALKSERAQWLVWLEKLEISAYRDPQYDYWQLLASVQADDSLQFFWQLFVVEACHTRSQRYLDLGLLALAKLPLSEDNSMRNLRLQVQALVNRYRRRLRLGVLAQQDLVEQLMSVRARNPSLPAGKYRVFLEPLLSPLGDDNKASVLAQLGLGQHAGFATPQVANLYKLQPPPTAGDADRVVREVRNSGSLAQAWQAIRPLLAAHEDYLRKSGDAYYFVRTLDRCARALCDHYELREPEIHRRLFQWIHLSLQIDSDDPRLWMLWELALRKAGYARRAQWVLWEMTRRFPENLPGRVELARLLASSADVDERKQANRLLTEVLELDPGNLHAYSTLAQVAIDSKDYGTALLRTQQALKIDPSNQPSAVLQAQAYARRNEAGDLDLAIDGLQRFVSQHKGQVNAEGYLKNLLARRHSTSQSNANEIFQIDSAQPVATETPETDPAWVAFAQSLSGITTIGSGIPILGTLPNNESIPGRMLPLPRALNHALLQNNWDANLLEAYDDSVVNEYPLETRLWKYLASLHSPETGANERQKLAQRLQDWVGVQTKALTDDQQMLRAYLETRSSELSGMASESAPAKGKAWLLALLDRHVPLPPPLLA